MSDPDLTNEELKRRLHSAEEALRRSERLAIAGRYAGAVMHEVNNPLEAITNLVFLSKNEADDAAQVRRNMQIAEDQLERLGEITRKTLSFYREGAKPEDFDLVEIAEAALRIHLRGSAADSVTVMKQLPERAIVSGCAGEILQVLSNFILNSMHALPEEDAALRLRLRIIGSKAHITIADNGCGIPPALHKSLFKPYITGRRGGTGLGLWLSRQIIERHHGTIRFRSSQRQGRNGTVFLLTLPLNQESELEQMERPA